MILTLSTDYRFHVDGKYFCSRAFMNMNVSALLALAVVMQGSYVCLCSLACGIFSPVFAGKVIFRLMQGI